MACIILETPNGTTYRWPDNQARTPVPGEKIVGVDWACGPQILEDEVNARLKEEGIQWGSAIKWVTQRIGLKQCSSCKAREEILNRVKELGWAQTLKELKETF
jgi:hypothetical protein